MQGEDGNKARSSEEYPHPQSLRVNSPGWNGSNEDCLWSLLVDLPLSELLAFASHSRVNEDDPHLICSH